MDQHAMLLALLNQLQALSPKQDGTAVRLTLRTATGDFLGEALVSEKAMGELTAWTAALNACREAAPTEPTPEVAADADDLDPLLLAALEDHFEAIDPMSYMPDVYAAESPEAAEAAFDQMVTGDWDGEL
ncbi:hypothetical protein [Streptomyces xanthochromogenes]